MNVQDAINIHKRIRKTYPDFDAKKLQEIISIILDYIGEMDLEVNKGQAMFLKKPNDKDLKEITLDEFEIGLMNLIRKDVQPKRLNPEDHNEEVRKVICDSPNPENN